MVKMEQMGLREKEVPLGKLKMSEILERRGSQENLVFQAKLVPEVQQVPKAHLAALVPVVQRGNLEIQNPHNNRPSRPPGASP